MMNRVMRVLLFALPAVIIAIVAVQVAAGDFDWRPVTGLVFVYVLLLVTFRRQRGS